MVNDGWRALLLAAIVLLPTCALAQANRPAGAPPTGVAWESDDWNPAAKPDDVVLPLPCNGAIALRRVVTGPPREAGKSNQLEDRAVTLGSTTERENYIGFLRSDHVAGGFFAADGQRYYLIGKYEVTVQQYESVMGDGSCKPTPPERAGLPASDISWYDAVEFTRRLNKWLYAEHLDLLPKSSGRPGFVRLPSEVEWEFAARGGLAVPDSERTNDTFVPAGADLGQYAWFAGPESSSGQLKPIGSLKPNPLGLHDMLGNAEEIVLEPFHLNRVGRAHGQPGGIIVRGGSYMTPRESMRTSTRTEFALYEPSSKDELRLSTFGFRIVVGATALNDTNQAAAIEKEWADASRTETSIPRKNPLEILDGLMKQAATPVEKARLQAAIEGLNTEIRTRNEVQARAIKSLLEAQVMMRSNILYAADNFDKLNAMAAKADRKGIEGDLARDARQMLDKRKPEFELWTSIYADIVQHLATDFRDDDVKAQANTLKGELVSRGRTFELQNVDANMKDIAAYRDNRTRDSRQLLRAVMGPRPWFP